MNEHEWNASETNEKCIIVNFCFLSYVLSSEMHLHKKQMLMIIYKFKHWKEK